MNIMLTVTLAAACAVHAQEPHPLTEEAKQAEMEVKNHIMKSAEKMPEADYGFKPAPRVRTFGQILGHIAEEQYFYCSAANSEQKAVDVERVKTSKADLIAALQDSFAFCDSVWDGFTDAKAVQMLQMGHTR